MALGLSKVRVDVPKHGVIAAIEPGAEIEGKLTLSSGTARINSHFKGEISGDGALLIAERGEVDAGIAVKSISVMGKVKGSVHASERLEIKERGVILGDIYTPVLVVEPGGYFDGQCHMPVQAGEIPKTTPEPDKEPSL